MNRNIVLHLDQSLYTMVLPSFDIANIGGGYQDRTGHLLLAKQPLSQMS
jgi:hypothetical protein